MFGDLFSTLGHGERALASSQRKPPSQEDCGRSALFGDARSFMKVFD
jgi:hypothetical protein